MMLTAGPKPHFRLPHLQRPKLGRHVFGSDNSCHFAARAKFQSAMGERCHWRDEGEYSPTDRRTCDLCMSSMPQGVVPRANPFRRMITAHRRDPTQRNTTPTEQGPQWHPLATIPSGPHASALQTRPSCKRIEREIQSTTRQKNRCGSLDSRGANPGARLETEIPAYLKTWQVAGPTNRIQACRTLARRTDD